MGSEREGERKGKMKKKRVEKKSFVLGKCYEKSFPRKREKNVTMSERVLAGWEMGGR